MGLKNTRTLCILSILLSFLLHTLFYLLAEKIPSSSLPQAQQEAIEFEVMSEKQAKALKKQKFIKDFDLKKQIETARKRAEFISRKTRRVLKQKAARRSGLTQNRTSKKIIPLSRLKSKPSSKKGLTLPRSKGDFALYPEGKPLPRITTEFNLSQKMESTLSTYIPNVERADITAIDTDQGTLRYYAFYSRLHDQLYPRWSNNIKEVLLMLSPKKYRYLAKKARVTTLQVILNDKGEFMGHFITKSSNDKMLDFAAVDAFRRAAPFINPPTDMVESDGFIYLPFNFRLVLEDRRFANEF